MARKRKSSIRRFALSALVIVFFCIFVVTSYAAYLVTRPLNLVESQIYVLEPGANATDIANTLHENGYLEYPQILVWTARIGRMERFLQAGEYQFQADFNVLQVLEKIVNGQSISHQIQFIEGWTFKDYLKELKAKGNLQQTITSAEYDGLVKKLLIAENHPEGWFFPDTYHYNSGQTDLSILQRAHEMMKVNLEQEWENSSPNLPYETAYEGLIVASIIQKESNVESEYPIIAGVIVNRLNQGMRLQMDPTVIYGLGGIDGPLKRSELDRDTPYNTYTRHGLPPTPIAMPGLAAIQAAARPAETTHLYFVARGDGTHQFSDTIDEHLKAVRAYRQRKKTQS